jgi:hypothetical protein
MILEEQAAPLFQAGTLSEEAERRIISDLLDSRFFEDFRVQRRLASYVRAIPSEKNNLILELMNFFWTIPYGKKLFSVFKDFENIFSLLGKKGHFVHQFEVFLFGLYLITNLLQLKLDKNRLSKFGTDKKLFLTWLLASTAHDLGYCLQVAKDIIARLSDLYLRMYMKNLAAKYKSIEENYLIDHESDLTTVKMRNNGRSYLIEIEAFLLDGIQASLNLNKATAIRLQKVLKSTNNHGYTSSLILCRTYLEYGYKKNGLMFSGNDWQIEALRKAASAIVLHALPPQVKDYRHRISFDSNPFAFILVLIDNLQEWSRTLFKNELWPSYHLIEFSHTDNKIYLSYLLEHDNWTKAVEREVRKYLLQKKQTISQLVRPRPPLGFQVVVDFSNNHGHRYDKIIVKL